RASSCFFASSDCWPPKSGLRPTFEGGTYCVEGRLPVSSAAAGDAAAAATGAGAGAAGGGGGGGGGAACAGRGPGVLNSSAAGMLKVGEAVAFIISRSWAAETAIVASPLGAAAAGAGGGAAG